MRNKFVEKFIEEKSKLVDAAFVLKQAMPKGAEKLGLSAESYCVLCVASEIGECSVLELADALKPESWEPLNPEVYGVILPPSLSRIIRDLKKRGLITITESPADRRSKIIRVTKKGLRIAGEV